MDGEDTSGDATPVPQGDGEGDGHEANNPASPQQAAGDGAASPEPTTAAVATSGEEERAVTPSAGRSTPGSLLGSSASVAQGQGSAQPSSHDASASSSVANVVTKMTVQALRQMRLRSATNSATASAAGLGDVDQQQAADAQATGADGAQQAGSDEGSQTRDGRRIGQGTGEGDAAGRDDDSTSTPVPDGRSSRGHTTSSGMEMGSITITGPSRGDDFDDDVDDGDDDHDDDADDNGDFDEDDDLASMEGLVRGDPVPFADSDEEDITDMMVLEPDHPLMKQFQQQVQIQLTGQKEQLRLKKAEKMEILKQKEKERDEIGISLYGLQQQLAKQQSQLEQMAEEQASVSKRRNKCELALTTARHKYQACMKNVRDHHSEANDLRTKLDRATLELRQLEAAAERMKSEMEVKKRTAKKVDQDVLDAEEAKMQKDSYITSLLNQLDRIQEQVSMYQMQMQAQLFETEQSKLALRDAVHELEVLEVEKKELFKQWNASLRAMQNRDEALSSLYIALRKEDERLVGIDAELNGYSRNIAKEQERNEALTAQRSKLENELVMVESQLEHSREKRRNLQMDYQAYTRSLHETEQQLQKAQTDRALRLREIDTTRQQTEREVAERLHLEDAILEKTMATLTLDKAAQYSRKVLGKLRENEKQRVKAIIECQGDIERTKLDIDSTQMECDSLTTALSNLSEKLDERNKAISRNEAEIKKRSIIIERKQNQIDQLNKKIDRILTERGGDEDVGPLELTVKTLKKQIEDSQDECRHQQQFWMRQENDLVKRMRESSQQASAIQGLKKKLIILEQRKIRQEAEIETEKQGLAELSNEIRQMQLDMVRLNAIISEKRGQEHNLIQGNILMESEFIGELKDGEREILQLEMDVGGHNEAKERLKNSLVESEQQIMLWEKKIQILKETQRTLASDEMEGEIRGLTSQVHLMQTKMEEVKRRQQALIRQMESSVKQRATINFKAEVKAVTGTAQQTKGHYHKQIQTLGKRLQQTLHNADACDKEVAKLRKSQKELAESLRDRQLSCEELITTVEKLQSDTDMERSDKGKLGYEVRWQQARYKHLSNAVAGRYTPLVRKDTGQSIDEEVLRHKKQTQALLTVSDEIARQFPAHQGVIQRQLLTPLRLRLRNLA